MKFWELKPVQSGAKALGAGFLALGAYYAYVKTGDYIAKRSDTPLVTLKKYFFDRVSNDKRINEANFDSIWALDPDTIEILLRLETFRKFAPYEYGDVVLGFGDAVELKHKVYSTELKATDSFNIRRSYQVVIEKLRVFRAVVEKIIPSAIEDFDEVAVDINAKIEQIASDAIQDTY